MGMASTVLTPPKRQQLWTYDQMVAELPESNLPMELWDGQLIKSPTPTPWHQNIVARFYRRLDDYTSARGCGEVFVSPLDVVLSPRRVVQPDVLFIATANKDIVRDRICGVPDLVMEVISPGSWQRDRVEKKELYEQFEVAEYWIVEPEARSIEVFALVKGAYQLHCRTTRKQVAKSRLLPGFKVSFNQLER
jgi:Uma2 family endonuclease